jgi:hypothetical protein
MTARGAHPLRFEAKDLRLSTTLRRVSRVMIAAHPIVVP